jgi:uncharacterized protein YutE (UPF0331/DUF86 family)
MSFTEARDSALLETVLARYEADGFDVFVHPARSVLPPFMQEYRPDAVAIGPDKKIAFEIVRSNETSADRLGRLRERFSGQQGWELIVLYVSPNSSTPEIEVATRRAIDSTTGQVVELRDAGQHTAALLIGWAALEAIARALMPQQLARPQPPAKLLEALASEGYLTPREADILRAAASVRNAAAHGRLGVAVDRKQLDALVSALRTLTKLLPKHVA